MRLLLIAATALTLGVMQTQLDSPPAAEAFPGENGKIAFHSQGNSVNFDFSAVNPDGNGLENLTNDPSDERFRPGLRTGAS